MNAHRSHRLADQAVVDQLDARLDAGTQKRIRSAPDAQPFPPRQIQHLPAFFEGDGQRLLRIDVFAGFKRLNRHPGVRLRHRQVDDETDVGIGQKLVDGAGAHAVSGGLLPRPVGVDVRAGDHFQAVKPSAVLQVNLADENVRDDS